MRPETEKILNTTAMTIDALRSTVSPDELPEFDAELSARSNRTTDAVGSIALNTVAAKSSEQAPTTADRLAQLPEEFSELVQYRYEQRAAFNKNYIRGGCIPVDYELPDISEFIDRIESLEPAFNNLYKSGRYPSVEFVPLGLSNSDWRSLFENYRASKYRKITPDNSRLLDPTIRSTFLKGIIWDVAVVDSSEDPILTDISKDGMHGTNPQRALEVLRKRASLDETIDDEDVIEQSTVTLAQYGALQLSRLERGEKPVDKNTYTFVRENMLSEKDGIFTVNVYYNSQYGGIKPKYWRGLYSFSYVVGPRIGISGTETLALRSAAA